jgi:hypothetical protein
VPHSSTPEGKYTLTTADHVIVWSSDFIDQWLFAGVPNSHIHVVGLPRTLVDDGYQQSDHHASQGTMVKTILVLAVHASTVGLPVVDWLKHVDSLRNLLKIPDPLKGKVRLILKLHPVHDYKFLYQEISDEEIEVIKEGKIKDLVRVADVMVLVNVPTSAYLLPLYENKPFLFVQTSDSFESDFTFGQLGGIAVITQDKDVWPILEQILFVPAVVEEILAANEAYLSQIISLTDDPIQNLKEIIVDIAAG